MSVRTVFTSELSLMHKCLAVTCLIVLIGLTTYVAVLRFGLVNVLGKIHLALIPSAILGVLTCLFIYINRTCWENVESCATPAHLLAWFILVVAFLAVQDPQLRLIVYLMWPIAPLSWIWLVKKCPHVRLSDAVVLGVHGGLGAYCLVLLANWVLSVAGIPLPVTPARFVMTIIPYSELASLVGASIVPIIVFLACFIEEAMFRLPLAIFKNFGMYQMAFLISFLFTYLHATTRLYLDSATLLQVLTCIACANAVFIAVFTRTMCVWSSTIAHLIYNMMVLAQVPPWLAYTMLLVDSVLYIYAKKRKII